MPNKPSTRHIYAVLTVRQMRVLGMIHALVERYGHGPETLRELAAEMRLPAAEVRMHVSELQRWGFIERGARFRTIRINPEERVAEIQAAIVASEGTRGR